MTDQPTKPTLFTWLKLLVTAPSRLIILDSPHSPDEALRRLQQMPQYTRMANRTNFMVRLPIKDNQRCFIGWIESGQDRGSRIVGQMQTLYPIALTRAAIGLFLFVMAGILMPAGRYWLVLILALGGTGFLLLSQYQRLIGRDVRAYVAWLQQVLDATQRR
jgi:hypothetical protein